MASRRTVALMLFGTTAGKDAVRVLTSFAAAVPAVGGFRMATALPQSSVALAQNTDTEEKSSSPSSTPHTSSLHLQLTSIFISISIFVYSHIFTSPDPFLDNITVRILERPRLAQTPSARADPQREKPISTFNARRHKRQVSPQGNK